MQDPKNVKDPGGDGFEKAIEPVRGIMDRIRALEHPEWGQKSEDIGTIKAALTRYSSELEHLKYRYDARGAELEKLKAQYNELEHKFLMRPDAMRRAGEMEVTELVKKKHDLAALEGSLEKVRLELGAQKEKLAVEAKEQQAARQAELEHEYAGKTALLGGREEKLASREKALAEAEKKLAERVEEARRDAVEELSSSFEHERAASRKERSILAGDLEKWRVKAEEALSCLAEARKTAEGLESAAESSKEAAAEARQKCRLAEMERTALLKRLDDWDAKGPEFEKWRMELSAREESCRRIEEHARGEAQPLRERISVLEEQLREEKHGADRWRLKAEEASSQLTVAKNTIEGLESEAVALCEAVSEARQRAKLVEMEKAACLERLEEWDKKGPQFEKWRSELAAREENCKRIEENAGKEAQPYRERIAALELQVRESEKAAVRARSRCDVEFPELEARLSAENARSASLREELKGVKEHLDKALKESAALEEELVQVKEKHLKAEAQKDAERSGKMESLLAGIGEKEREMEESWTRRHKALEAEQKGYHAEFEKRQLALLEDLKANSAGIDKLYAQKEAKLLELNKRLIEEFQDREAKARAVEEELRVQAANLAASAEGLGRDYEAKTSELEAIKLKLLAELK